MADEAQGEEEASERVGTRLMFENDRVRVWDLALEPGEALEKHVHRDDYLFIVVRGGSLRHVDPTHPENDRAVEYADDQVVFLEAGEGLVHDRLVNTGDAPYRNLVIELKRG
jgi:redox-sensitive bicupin YhaK (pirin superfamily)